MHKDHVWLGEEPGYVAAFRLAVSTNIADIYFNSNNVSLEEISSLQSWQDLLHRSWRGRVVAVLDPDARLSTSHWHAPWQILGRKWFDRFVRENRPKLLPENSQRELVDGLARGKYDVAVFLPTSAKREIERLGEAGMPVRKLTRTLVEGELRELKGALGVLDRAPHPAAARLFVNWYLSQEGQTAFHTLIESDDPSRSLRTDVPQGKVSDEVWEISADTRNVGNIRSDPELAAAALQEAADFIKATCAEVGCYGY
jgi:iron(III) transport system substrate-binding protein